MFLRNQNTKNMKGGRYSITPRLLSPDSYYLHAEGCPFEGNERQSPIGFFGSAEEALDACRNMDLKVTGCRFCSGHVINSHAKASAGRFIKSIMVHETPESALVCAVN